MRKKLPSAGKKLPRFKSDEEMVRFVETHDMSPYMNSKNFVPFEDVFEFEAKNATITMRFPPRLLDAVKAKAAKKHMPYQRYIRRLIENDVGQPTSRS
jgi:predicted DNA binding CopG/RHH family protein